MALSYRALPPNEPLTSIAMTSVERATRGLSPAAAEHPATAPNVRAAAAAPASVRALSEMREDVITLSSASDPLVCASCPFHAQDASGAWAPRREPRPANGTAGRTSVVIARR